MTRTYTETITMQEDTCCVCGVTFAAPKRLLESKRENGGAFYCPNGHSLSYTKSEVTRLREQVQTEKERIKQLEMQLTSVNDQLKAAEREMTRHKKRTANGVCPCCHRSFAQLQRHMKTKHPDYAS